MDLAVILAFASAFCAAAIACAVAWCERRSLACWSCVAGMVLLALESLFAGLTADAVLPQEVIFWQRWRLLAASLLTGCWLLFSLSYARGNYREFLVKWRVALAAALLVPMGLAIGFRENLVVSARHVLPNQEMLSLGPAGFVLNLLLLLSALLVLMNLERTFRASAGTMRWRIKFMVLGLGLLFAVRAYSSSQTLLLCAVSLPLQVVDSVALFLACLLILRALLRTGHFDLNVCPSHFVLHNSLTMLLAGIYLVIVGLLAKLVHFLGGDAAFPFKAFVVMVSLVLLAMLLVSDQVRLHTKRFISRHLQRPLYDYQTVWRAFTEGTARCVERSDFCAAIVKLVSEIFQALSVTLWLVDDREERFVFGASTSLITPEADQLAPSEAAQAIAWLSGHPEPVDLDSSRERWALALKSLHPDDFHKGGNRIGMPLVAGGELLGIITLGDRVGGTAFSLQDFDLLKSVGTQAAAGLLNSQLSQRLSQAKQLEAFQAMSAFFVHDLKNTASTLSLMLENLPVHFQDPRFREDALRGISKTIIHINAIINRLGLLRQEFALHPVESDLNQLVNQALQGLAQAPQFHLVTELQPLPKVRLDPVQIQNVVINLLLNARDAVGSNGRLQIQTSRRNGWVVLAVADNGCGMSPDFVEHSLFRPFQTTKKTGLGIGMFHCKVIIEAHRGRIEVESQQGKGTTFRVLLPLKPAIP